MGVQLKLISVFSVSAWGAVASAQVVNPPVLVPNAACRSCVPDDIDPCCKAKILACVREDGDRVVTQGSIIKQFDTTIDCNTCYSNCPCCPVLLESGGPGHAEGDCLECSEIPSEICLYATQICHTEQQYFSISPTLEIELGVSALAAFKASLALEIGQGTDLTHCFESTCGWPSVRPCQYYEKKPYIEFRLGSSVSVDHTWAASGEWITGPGCSDDPCPIAGTDWYVDPCTTGSSTLTGTVYAGGSCGDGTIELECP